MHNRYHERVRRHARAVHHHINRHAEYWLLFLVTAGIIALQLLYPLDRALPFARLGGQFVSQDSYENIAGRINRSFLESKGVVRIDDTHTATFALGDAGLQPNVDSTTARLTEYPLWQRLIPLSIFFSAPDVRSIDMTITPSQQGEFVHAIAAKLTQPPTDAGLAIKDGQLVMTNDVPGTKVTERDIRTGLSTARYLFGTTTITVPSQSISAAKPRQYFEAVRTKAEQLLAQSVTITIGERVVSPSRVEVAGWLSIGEQDGQAVLTTHDAALDSYLKKLQDSATTPAGTTNVTRVDGRETAREEGASGRTIDIAALRAQIVGSVEAGQVHPMTAQYVALAPTVVINKKYSSTEAGLRAYVADQAATRNVRIMVEQIGGTGWQAAARETESTVSASTYKLFVALMLFDRMDRGEISWGTPILDTDTKTCFERMIVASTNACAEEWIRRFGSKNINDFIYSKGFSTGTSFTNPLANHTTAADLARYFKGLHEGWLMSPWARQYLLDALKRHHYTKGIPSGTAGSAHNKVGFLWDYSNDSAIVYHPRGTYAIAIMTKGLSFYAIAGITREIEAIMYP